MWIFIPLRSQKNNETLKYEKNIPLCANANTTVILQ